MKKNRFFLLGIAAAVLAALFSCATTGGSGEGLSGESPDELSLEEAIELSAAELAAELPAGTRVAIAAFASEDERLSEYIMKELAGALVDGDLEVADRRNLAYVYRDFGFQMSGDVSDETAAFVGKFLGATYVITGQLVKAGNSRRYRLSGVNVETAAQESSTRLDVRDDRALKRLIAGLQNNTLAASAASYGETGGGPPKTAGAFLDRGLLFASRGDYDNAIADFTEALRINPNYTAAYYNRGRAYYCKDDWDRAIEDHSAALKIDPNDVYAYNFRATVYYFNKGDRDRAIEDYGTAEFLFSKGDYDRAIADYSAALKIDPNNVYAYTFRGHAYAKKGDWDRAIEDYSAVLRIDPNDADAYNNRGLAYYGKGDWDRAIEDYNAILRIDPNNAAAWYNRGNVYYSKGMYDRAIEDFNAVLRINPNYLLAKVSLELAREERGR